VDFNSCQINRFDWFLKIS